MHRRMIGTERCWQHPPDNQTTAQSPEPAPQEEICAGQSVPCDCCGQATSRSREFGRCLSCTNAGCAATRDGDGEMSRGAACPLLAAGLDVVACLQCNKPLHYSAPLTFVDNSNPGLGGCHTQCVDAYHAAQKGRK